MNFEIITTPEFEKELKRLCKKYVSMKMDYVKLLLDLQENRWEKTVIKFV